MSEQGLITHVPTPEELEARHKPVLLRDGSEASFVPAAMTVNEGRYGDIQNPVIAEIVTGAPFERLVIFQDKVASPEDEPEYFVMNATTADQKTFRAKAVLGTITRQNSRFFIGREDLRARGINAPQEMSKNHAVISLDTDGRISVADLHSSNGTELYIEDKEPHLTVK